MFRVYVRFLPPKLRSFGALLLVCWRKRLDLYFPLCKQIGVGFFSVFVGKALAALASREDVLKFSDMFLGLNPLKAN